MVDNHIIAGSVATYPVNILVNIGGIDYEKKIVVAAHIDKKVVDRASVGMKHHSVEAFTRLDTAHVVCKDVIDKIGGTVARHKDFTHVRHVENAAGMTHGIMLLDNALILYGHVKSAERTHLRSERQMLVVKARFSDIFHDQR